MTLLEVQAALADQIRTELADDELEVFDRLAWFPTPPCIDIYPHDPFQDQERFGVGNDVYFFDVRARVNTPDNEGAQELLLAFMDPKSGSSVQQAILADRTLGGAAVDALVTEGPSNFGIYPDPGGKGAYLGCIWVVRVSL